MKSMILLDLLNNQLSTLWLAGLLEEWHGVGDPALASAAGRLGIA